VRLAYFLVDRHHSSHRLQSNLGFEPGRCAYCAFFRFYSCGFPLISDSVQLKLLSLNPGVHFIDPIFMVWLIQIVWVTVLQSIARKAALIYRRSINAGIFCFIDV
jgi:hypothetical protein